MIDAFLKSQQRPIRRAHRWHDVKRGRRDISPDMIRDAVRESGCDPVLGIPLVEDLVSELREVAGEPIPTLDEVHHLAIRADAETDIARQLAAIDGMTDGEALALELALLKEMDVMRRFVERLRRLSRHKPTLRVGRVDWWVVLGLALCGVSAVFVVYVVSLIAR